MSFKVVIPARFGSSRLPGKPLLMIQDKPMVLHVVERARQSQAQEVIVATDDVRIEAVLQAHDVPVVLTRSDHPSGTDRLQEVAEVLGWASDDIIVNVQGDEPLIPPSVINLVADNLRAASQAGIATLAEPINDVAQLFNPNIVKLVRDHQDFALYFSRAPMPWARDDFAVSRDQLPAAAMSLYLRHLGIYAYRVGFLHDYVSWPPALIEQVEALEQLRALYHGVRIHVGITPLSLPPGVDTAEDLERVRAVLAGTGAAH